MHLTRFAKFAWFVLAFNISVILWGAYVRATGSGAGCGSHWPLCNGEVLPTAPEIETIIEFAHRLSSGLALVFVLVMFIWGLRGYPNGHIIRKGVWFSLVFIITEALVGAGLVLFSWVAQNELLARVISMAVHLVNTFLLLASLALTAWWASGGQSPSTKNSVINRWFFFIAFLGMIILGVTGAITALGDTLFPSETLSQGIQADFSPTAHFLIRLRVWHPLIAVAEGIYVMVLSVIVGLADERNVVKRLSMLLGALIFLQLVAGLVNLFMLAPVPLQIIHLLLADLVWICLVLFTASAFGGEPNPDADSVLNSLSENHSEISPQKSVSQMLNQGVGMR